MEPADSFEDVICADRGRIRRLHENIILLTDVGMVRTVNQDYVYTTDKPVGHLPNLFVVADGMGGHRAGDYASKYTVEVLERELKRIGRRRCGACTDSGS